jgi:transposase
MDSLFGGMDAPTLTAEMLAALPAEVVAFVNWLLKENARLQSRVADLESEVAELRNRLNKNSSNSSKPPSTDLPSQKPAPKKPPSGKRQGGQPGHQRNVRPPLLPTRTVDVKPPACSHCGTMLLGDDPKPQRKQVVDLPVIQPDVTDYLIHQLTCVACGRQTRAQTPSEAQHEHGARLQAFLSALSGLYRLSKRSVEGVCEDWLGVPISTGQICDLERQTSEILQPLVEQANDYVRERPANVDETSWKQGKNRAWVWVAATKLVAVFAIHLSRSRESFHQLMGRDPRHPVTSDRYGVYSHLLAELRQLCWAHLRRDFQAMIDRANAGQPIGEELLRLADQMLGQWKRVRDGTLSRAEFRDQILPTLRTAIEAALERGLVCGCAKTMGVCMELLRWRVSLWTFAHHEDVEPTNNAAERAVRHAVCWRKTSYGTMSETGSRFVERILTVVASCKLQGRNVLDFLTQTIQAARNASPLPTLLPA